MDEFIQKLTTFMEAQQQAEKHGQQEFTCPLCGAKAIWSRSTYSNHLHCGCTSCGIHMME